MKPADVYSVLTPCTRIPKANITRYTSVQKGSCLGRNYGQLNPEVQKTRLKENKADQESRVHIIVYAQKYSQNRANH